MSENREIYSAGKFHLCLVAGSFPNPQFPGHPTSQGDPIKVKRWKEEQGEWHAGN